MSNNNNNNLEKKMIMIIHKPAKDKKSLKKNE